MFGTPVVNDGTAFGILGVVQVFLKYLIPVLVTLAVVYFIWGVVTYVVSGDEEAKKNARSKIIYGLIGLFVIVAFWGIINIFAKTFNIAPGGGPTALPCVPDPFTHLC